MYVGYPNYSVPGYVSLLLLYISVSYFDGVIIRQLQHNLNKISYLTLFIQKLRKMIFSWPPFSTLGSLLCSKSTPAVNTCQQVYDLKPYADT